MMDGIQQDIHDVLRKAAEDVAGGKYGPGLEFDYCALEDDLEEAFDGMEES